MEFVLYIMAKLFLNSLFYTRDFYLTWKEVTVFYIYTSWLYSNRLCMLPNFYPCSKKLKSSLYRLTYSGKTLQKAVMCSIPLLCVPIPALSDLPNSSVLPCSNRNKSMSTPAMVPSCALSPGEKLLYH